jgi:hypothetical protein
MKMPMMALVFSTTLGAHAAAAQTGLCTQQINQFEAAVRQSSLDPGAGPTATETAGAKLGHQPTPASVEAAETGAQSRFASLLANARALDAGGKHAACMRALTEAELTFDQR